MTVLRPDVDRKTQALPGCRSGRHRERRPRAAPQPDDEGRTCCVRLTIESSSSRRLRRLTARTRLRQLAAGECAEGGAFGGAILAARSADLEAANTTRSCPDKVRRFANDPAGRVPDRRSALVSTWFTPRAIRPSAKHGQRRGVVLGRTKTRRAPARLHHAVAKALHTATLAEVKRVPDRSVLDIFDLLLV